MWMLLHGFTGSPASWDAVLGEATLGAEPSRPSLAGHGPDWRDVDSVSFDTEVARLSAMAGSLAPPRCVAGYSLGARLALGMLVANPDLFDGALLIGVHPGLDDDRAREQRRESDAALARLLRTEGLRAFISSWEQQPLFESQRWLPASVTASQRAIRASHDAEGLARSLEALGLAAMPGYRNAIARTRAAITLMAGSLDTKFRDVALDLAEEHPHVRSIVVDGVGHNLLLEASEAVAAAMRDVEREAARTARRE